MDRLPLTCHQVGNKLATQACALTGNRTGDLSVHRPALNPVRCPSQGITDFFLNIRCETAWRPPFRCKGLVCGLSPLGRRQKAALSARVPSAYSLLDLQCWGVGAVDVSPLHPSSRAGAPFWAGPLPSF